MYQKSVEEGQHHFADMEKSPLTPIQEAKVQVLSAKVVDIH